MVVRVLLNANNRTKTDVSDNSLYVWENLPILPSIVHFYLRKSYICTLLLGNRQEGEQVILMDIRVLLNANNRTETDFADEPLFWRKSAQLAVYCTFLFKEIGLCTILSENHKEGEQIMFKDIRVLLNANNRTETAVSDNSLYVWENLPILPSIVHFYLRKSYICSLLLGNRQEGEQIIFMDIRVLLNANNRTETDFADEPLFWRKSAQLAVYCTFLFKEIGLCTILSENHNEGEQIMFKGIRVLLNANNRTETAVSDNSLYFWENLPIWPSIVHFYIRKCTFAPFYWEIANRESKSFSWILDYSLKQIIVPKQILLVSLYFGENLPNCLSSTHLYLRKFEYAPFYRKITKT